MIQYFQKLDANRMREEQQDEILQENVVKKYGISIFLFFSFLCFSYSFVLKK